jgi:hypothetical protein
VPINLLCGNRENREELDHYLDNYPLHFGGRWYLGVYLETLKEKFHALKNLNDYAVTRVGIPDCLM